MQLHDKIRKRVERLGLTQRQLAKMTNLSQTKVCHLLTAKQDFRVGELHRIALALRTSASALLKGVTF